MVKTYILAPNWTTAPPPDGPLKLGHLLDDLTEFVPVNRKSTVAIPARHLNKVDTKNGFKTSRKKLVSGQLGFFAKVVGLFGIGVGAHMYYKRDDNDVLACKTLDTMTFDPTAEYVVDAMNLAEIKTYMRGCKYKAPLYMVTGLKVARGASMQTSNNLQEGVKLNGGIQSPGLPVQAGGKGSLSMQQTESESWEGSTDFIVAFRVRKIWYHRGDLKNKAHNKNVVMQDGTPVQKDSDLVLKADDDITVADVFTDRELTTDKDGEDGEEVKWIIPNTRLESA